MLHLYHDFDDEDDESDHFLVVSKPHVLFNRCYWCDKCNKAYYTRIDHACADKCNCCFQPDKCDLTGWKVSSRGTWANVNKFHSF